MQPYLGFYKPNSTVQIEEDFIRNEAFNFGDTKQSILKKYGSKHINVEIAEKKIEVLQYKFIIEGEKVKKQFNFYNGRLFIFSEIYSYLPQEMKKS